MLNNAVHSHPQTLCNHKSSIELVQAFDSNVSKIILYIRTIITCDFTTTEYCELSFLRRQHKLCSMNRILKINVPHNSTTAKPQHMEWQNAEQTICPITAVMTLLLTTPRHELTPCCVYCSPGVL